MTKKQLRSRLAALIDEMNDIYAALEAKSAKSGPRKRAAQIDLEEVIASSKRTPRKAAKKKARKAPAKRKAGVILAKKKPRRTNGHAHV